jgi:hypothetical protein
MSIKASEQVAVLGVLAPASQATGAGGTGWVSAAKFAKFLAIINTGVLGASATVDAKFQQALDNAGTGAKDVPGRAITQVVVATGNNSQALLNMDEQDLDANGGFSFIKVVTNVGAAASIFDVLLLGFDASYGPASDSNAATVLQVAG